MVYYKTLHQHQRQQQQQKQKKTTGIYRPVVNL
jgi:hypothetical protein